MEFAVNDKTFLLKTIPFQGFSDIALNPLFLSKIKLPKSWSL